MRHVTDILARCGLYEWPHRISETDRGYYLERGQYVHEACRLYDEANLDLDALSDGLRPYLTAYARFRCECGGMIVAAELPVSSEDYGYEGRLDRLIGGCALHPTGLLLLDLKTSDYTPAVRLQTAGYALAYREGLRGDHGEAVRGLRRGVVALRSDGTWRSEVFDNDQRDEAVWVACLGLHSWMESACVQSAMGLPWLPSARPKDVAPGAWMAWRAVKAWKTMEGME